jgi:hypothetical protein
LKHCVHAQWLHGHRSVNRPNGEEEAQAKAFATFVPAAHSSPHRVLPGWQLGVATTKAHFDSDAEVRVLSPQPRSRVSVARLSRSRALRAAPFALTGAHVGQSGLTDPGERSANKSRVSPVRCASPVAPLSQQRSNVESRGSGRLRCNCIRKVSPTRKRCPCVLPVQFRRSLRACSDRIDLPVINLSMSDESANARDRVVDVLRKFVA